jgi:hypothetical protein
MGENATGMGFTAFPRWLTREAVSITEYKLFNGNICPATVAPPVD